MGNPFKLYNSLSRKTEDFVPQREGRIDLYVCGMTVYDHCHIGHARAMVVFDTVVRYLRHRGWQVRFVRNFTDVDDKIIVRANERGIAPATLAQQYVDAFREDAHNLGLVAPDIEPRVTESMAEIVAMIAELVEKKHAYVSAGNVWFSVGTCKDYGKLSGRAVEELRSADAADGKAAPADFALWKSAKPGEPSWESPWGPGRPGWHIECSAMSKHCLGETIDIHGGGLDLIFPHHENEIAQSECANHAPYVRYWMHNGLLNMESGQKMGKSLGNVINVRDALQEFPSEALRLYYLQNHYRSPLPWDDSALSKALGMLARLYEARETAEAMRGEQSPVEAIRLLGDDAKMAFDLGESFPTNFYQAMDHDFNTAQALGYLFELARAINRLGNHKKARSCARSIVEPALTAFSIVGDAIGLLRLSSQEFQEEVKRKRLSALGISRNTVEEKLTARTDARRNKQWERSDAIRQELDALGIVVMDLPDGNAEWRIKI